MIDDDGEIVELVREILRRDGHRVLGANDASAALSLVDEERPALVLLDLMMPYMDGEAFLIALPDRLNGDVPPFVLVTASIARHEVAWRSGAAASLEKPFDPDDIRDIVARFVEP